ncbi:outer membrane beta-barrel protein [Chryseolinea lacunae]|uniref:Outer membrane beta-barrel protein n=1 Tax=Chryseolinea lacunae TaxID=2801331 RepID=A0ABS1KNI4_9BACT|nr:outer membrane beta-barrel protein [Chryseolinea lacunae]MBL0740986.1 outer membrane beta-barrel protein [Chryseolinea lacunae]
MKKIRIYISILFIGAFHSVAHGQSDQFFSNKVLSKFEFTTGIGMLRGPSYYTRENKIGFSFGAGVSHAFSKTFELKARALYELKGSKTTNHMAIIRDGVFTDYSRALNTNQYFLTLALLPTFHITAKKNILIGAGGFYSFLKKLRIREELTDNITHITTTTNHNRPSNQSPYNEFGISAYTGYVFSLSGKTDLTIMLHINKSLKDFDNAYSNWQRNNVLLLSATFGITR